MTGAPTGLACSWAFLAALLALTGVIAGAELGGDFRLTADDGNSFSLAQTRGKVVLLAFGYTYCPDICPMTMAELSQVVKALGKDADKTQVLFVTLDPERDTAERLDLYLEYFDPRFIGLTGTAEAIHDVARRYGVRYEIHRDPNTALGYTVDHSTDIYLVDPRGELAAILPFGTPIGRTVAVVKESIEHGAGNGTSK